MARASTIRVMISSRCNDPFPFKKGNPLLSEIRKELKKEIEAQKLFGAATFEVWINEETPPQGGAWTSWEVCQRAVNDCDVLIALSNGNAGWATEGGDIGICHMELMTGMSNAPGKTYLVSLGSIPTDASPEGKRNKRFQDYVLSVDTFRGGNVNTIEDLKKRIKEALRSAVVDLVQSGVREASKARFSQRPGARLDQNGLQRTPRRC